MTRLVGVPNSVPTGTSVRVTLHWEVPYRDPARGATPNVLTATYDWADGKYKIGGTEMAFVHPRPDQPDPALKGSLVAAYTIGTGASAARPRYVLQAHETAPGELDMRVDPSPTQVIAAQSLLGAIAAASGIPAKIAQVDQKLAQVDDSLAGIAQDRAATIAATEDARAATARVEADVDRTFEEVAWGVGDENGRAALSIDLSGDTTVHGTLTVAGAVHEPTDGVAWAVADTAGRMPLYLDDQGVTHGTFQDMSAVTLPVPTRDITAWGDSMTEGAGTDNFGGAWLTQLATRHPDLMAGRTLTKRGIVGQTSDQIAGRAGGRVTLLTGFRTLPASGPVALTPSINLLDPARVNTSPQPYATSIRGRIKHVLGTLSVAADGSYTFTRDTAGTALPIAAEGVVFAPDVDRRAITIIWAGRNNLLYPDQIVADVQSVTDRLYEEVAAPRYLVISVVNMQDEEPAGHLYNDKAREVNSKLMRLYGDRFIDVRGAVTAGRADDTPDPQYMSPDKLHFSAAGYALVADLVAAALTAKGW